MRAKSRTRNRPTDGWTIGVEFDESSLLNREQDSPRREWAREGCDEGKKNDRPEEEILYRWNSCVNPYPPFSSDPFYPRGLGHRRESGRRKRKRKVASDLGEDV